MSEEEEDVAERHFTLLYGTETGNAQDVAERIARQARRRRIDTSVYAMDDYDVVSDTDCPLFRVLTSKRISRILTDLNVT